MAKIESKTKVCVRQKRSQLVVAPHRRPTSPPLSLTVAQRAPVALCDGT